MYLDEGSIIHLYGCTAFFLKYIGINSTDIWYIGNDYHFDVHGSNISGLTPVWINRYNDDNPLDINCINVSNYIELCDYIRGLLDD